MAKCELFRSDHVKPGWICCCCKTFTGVAKTACPQCGHERCKDPTETILVTPKRKIGRPPGKREGITWNFDGGRRKRREAIEEEGG